jgi:hypothetical protein
LILLFIQFQDIKYQYSKIKCEFIAQHELLVLTNQKSILKVFAQCNKFQCVTERAKLYQGQMYFLNRHQYLVVLYNDLNDRNGYSETFINQIHINFFNKL